MSSNNNEPKKDVQDQVKNLLSGLGGAAGEFLSQPVSGRESTGKEGPVSFGQLHRIVLAFTCEANHLHLEDFSPEKFDATFSGENPQGYFDNFSAIGMFQVGQNSNQIEKVALDDLLQIAKDYEQLKLDFKYVQALADDLAIKNSHLEVEKAGIRRELDRLKAARNQQQEPAGETALDFPATTKRRWTFGMTVKKIRVIGGEGQ